MFELISFCTHSNNTHIQTTKGGGGLTVVYITATNPVYARGASALMSGSITSGKSMAEAASTALVRVVEKRDFNRSPKKHE
jgi:hypothetical protein